MQQLRRLAQDSLYFFCRAVLGFDFMTPRVHGPMCDFLQSPGHRKRLTAARGFLKTSIATVGKSIWNVLPPREEYVRMGQQDPWHDPNHRILIVQNTDKNASAKLHTIKSYFEKNQLLQTLFPEIIPSSFNKMRWSDHAAEIKRDGVFAEATFEAAGVGSEIVSRHYTKIIEDDTLAPEDEDFDATTATPSLEKIEKAIGFHRSMVTYLVNQKDEILYVATRWAKNDVVQHIIDKETPPYKHFEISIWDPTQPGKVPVYPERFDLEVIEALKSALGPYLFSSQYENNPLSAEDMVFQPEWLQNYYDEEPNPSSLYIYMSIDPAWSKKKRSDNTAIVCAGGSSNGDLYVLEYVANKLSVEETVEAAWQMFKRRNPRKVFVETVAYQQALRVLLERKSDQENEYIPLESFTPGPEDRKETRIMSLQPIAARGQLKFKRYHKELIQELLNFPDPSSKDDIADALATIAINMQYPLKKPEFSPSKLMLAEEILEELRSRSSYPVPFGAQTGFTDPDTMLSWR